MGKPFLTDDVNEQFSDLKIQFRDNSWEIFSLAKSSSIISQDVQHICGPQQNIVALYIFLLIFRSEGRLWLPDTRKQQPKLFVYLFQDQIRLVLSHKLLKNISLFRERQRFCFYTIKNMPREVAGKNVLGLSNRTGLSCLP